jgi:hypothetical protein
MIRPCPRRLSARPASRARALRRLLLADSPVYARAIARELRGVFLYRALHSPADVARP